MSSAPACSGNELAGWMTISGVPALHVSGNLMGSGKSFGLPSGAPAPTQAEIVWISCSVRLRSPSNTPWALTGFHGGISPVITADRI